MQHNDVQRAKIPFYAASDWQSTAPQALPTPASAAADIPASSAQTTTCQ
jgi:hypothetical protein